jgi:hypothetical protein
MSHYIGQHEEDDTWSIIYGGKFIAPCQTEDDVGRLINILQDRDAMDKFLNNEQWAHIAYDDNKYEAVADPFFYEEVKGKGDTITQAIENYYEELEKERQRLGK